MGFWGSVGSLVSDAVDAISSIFSSDSCNSGDESSSSSTHNSSSSSSVQTLYEPDKVKIAELELQIAQTNSENARMLLQEQKELIRLNAQMHSSSSVQTLHEPDKVKIAELELQIAQTNSENAQMLLQEQKELIRINAQMQGAIIEAEAKSFQHSAEVLKELMKSINIIAQQRLELIENGQLEIVKKIENLYSDFEKEVKKDNFNFQMNQLPQMMEMLEKFPPESSSHKLYSKSVEKQIDINTEFISRKLSDLSKRQQMLVESTEETKKIVLEHSNKIVENRMQFLEQQLESRKELAQLNKVEQISEVKKLTN
jgi:hypothetical protein